ncbi:MutS -like protein 4 [Trichinella pseudospiralis]|uniref:MutS-like protein 4 n=1 Tax=Trichinella pseudospiralis TaxID=6337 RepID=A0A0V1IGT5_TRIPS|nr:MutS -like protein 4 [Trichinella pseudospiralis]KRZ35228.1 MutS -like protein 4 [Trichinella pseudospiralis]
MMNSQQCISPISKALDLFNDDEDSATSYSSLSQSFSSNSNFKTVSENSTNSVSDVQQTPNTKHATSTNSLRTVQSSNLSNCRTPHSENNEIEKSATSADVVEENFKTPISKLITSIKRNSLRSTYSSEASLLFSNEKQVSSESAIDRPSASTSSNQSLPLREQNTNITEENRINESRKKNMLARKFSSCSTNKTSTSSTTTPRSGCGKPIAKSQILIALTQGRGLAKGEIGMAYMDLLLPELCLTQFSDSASYAELKIKLEILNPAAIILPDSAMLHDGNTKMLLLALKRAFPKTEISSVSRKCFHEMRGLEELQRIMLKECSDFEKNVEEKYYALAAAAALIDYIERAENIVFAPQSIRIVYKGLEKSLKIDSNAAKDLELIVSLKSSDSVKGSLLGILNHTYTFSGARLLRASILQPSSDLQTINEHLDVLEEILNNGRVKLALMSLRSAISRMTDVERLIGFCIHVGEEDCGRFAEYRIKQLLCLKNTLELIEPLRQILSTFKTPLLKQYFEVLGDKRLQKISEKISHYIYDDTTLQKGALNLRNQICFAIKPNVNGLLDVVRRAYSEFQSDVEAYYSMFCQETQLSFKLSFSIARGYYLALPNSGTNVPANVMDRLLKVVRRGGNLICTTREMIKLNDRIEEIVRDILFISDNVLNQLLTEMREDVISLYYLCDVISSLDMILSLSKCCERFQWIRPEFTDSLAVEKARHPVLELSLQSDFVANDIYAGPDSNFLILSGPNMSGKTTYLKMVGVLQVLAQIGSFVPAKYASFKLCNQLFTRLYHNDSLETNSSSFMVEMKDCKYILENCTSDSLVLIDELGRNTSDEEGFATCVAISEELIATKATVFFATHLLDLAELDRLYPCVDSYHFVANQGAINRRIHVTHDLKRGLYCGPVYGLELAELAPFPKEIVERAKCWLRVWRNEKQNNESQLSSELKKQRAVMRFGYRIIQAAQFHDFDPVNVLAYFQHIKKQYLDDIGVVANSISTEDDDQTNLQQSH